LSAINLQAVKVKQDGRIAYRSIYLAVGVKC